MKHTAVIYRNAQAVILNIEAPPPLGYSKSGKPLNFEETATGNRAKIRSKTFPGIAKAMAEQWGE